MGLEIRLIRVTIIDREQKVSFLATQETMLRLVAGCSANPATLGELLVAADIYEPGIAAAVMADLMEFDKVIRQKGTAFIDTAITQSRTRQEEFRPAFQVINEVTEQEAYNPRGGQLVVIDLAGGVIRASAGVEISLSGEVKVEAGKKPPIPTVTYILPEHWTIETL